MKRAHLEDPDERDPEKPACLGCLPPEVTPAPDEGEPELLDPDEPVTADPEDL